MRQYQISVEDNMSKEDEQKLLEKLRDVFTMHPDNYLASLFTQELTDWSRIQMKNDFTLDVVEYIEGYHELTGKVQSLEGNLDTQARNTKEMIELATRAKDDKIAEMTQDSDILSNNYAAITAQVDKLRIACAEANGDRNNLARINDEYTDEITSLKAQLFDLMTKESR